jgi:hypothetical protein
MSAWITHGIVGLGGTIIGLVVAARVLGPSNAVINGERWMHDRGVHPSHVSCSYDDQDHDGEVLCVFFVPNEGAETVQIFECESVAFGSCHEPGE